MVCFEMPAEGIWVVEASRLLGGYLLFVSMLFLFIFFFFFRAFEDARVQPIYGGTNESMKERIARHMVSQK